MTKLPDNPDLMVIGDSFAQGCRSMTVNASFCKASYSAVAAGLAGKTFRPPDHPRDVIFNLEDLASDILEVGLATFLGGAKSNLQSWLNDFKNPGGASPGGADCFDNIAVAGFTLEDVMGDSLQADGSTGGFGTPALAVNNYLSPYETGATPLSLDSVGDLHLAVNARYVLNPSNNPAYMGWSQLQWVIARQPKNLIVHVGHNNGLYKIGSKGETTDWYAYWTSTAPNMGFQKVQTLLSTLHTSCPNTQILVMGLPKVGAVSNLMPASSDRVPGTNYFTQYSTVFPSVVSVPGNVVADADSSIANINSRIAAYAATLSGVQTYSVFDFIQRFDTKNGVPGALKVQVQFAGDPARSLPSGYFLLDNNYITGQYNGGLGYGDGSIHFSDGGLQTIDGMHPSSISYALIGFDVANLLFGVSKTDTDIAVFLDSIVGNEALVVDFPFDLDTLLDLLHTFAGGTSSVNSSSQIAQYVAAVSSRVLNA